MPVTMLKGLQNLSASTYKGEIVADETFVAGDTDFQAALTKMKGKTLMLSLFLVTIMRLVKL